jgi:arabinofuranosyltransferase
MPLSPATVPAAAAAPSSPARLARISLLLLFTYVFLANAWVGDDAYITFRVVWNVLNGYGLTFNPVERVQAYTHPLWMGLLTVAHFVTGEFFFTSTFVSWALCVAAGVVLVRWAGPLPRGAVLVAWLLTSKALVDYTASGLENPLSYLLLALFYARYLSLPADAPAHANEVRGFVLLASLGFLNRPDAILLYAIPLADIVWRGLRRFGRPVWTSVALGAAPAVLWLLFATVYYGFPLPNTYYAKVATGVPRGLMMLQGLAYLLNSVRHDPLTLGTILLGLVYAVRTPGPARHAALSAALYVAFVVWVGGDFMSGRFFAAPFLVSAMVVVPEIARLAAPWVAGGLVLYTLLLPLAPIKTGPNYDGAWPWRTQNGIKDERGHYHQGTNILFFSPFRELPDFTFAREGRSFRDAPNRVAIHGSIGMFGLFAGPEKYVIDRNALSDPLLARLPVSPRLYFEFYAGHYFRDIPAGYVESCEQGENVLTDPALHDYYDRLLSVIRGPLFRLDRFRNIWALNFGRDRSWAASFEKRRPIALSIRADNERFLTDVGRRDTVAGSLRSTGRAGLLQYGPRMPLKAGAYRARWVGTVQAPSGAEIGFVDVKLDEGQPLKRLPVISDGLGNEHQFAEIDFSISEPVSAIEYRLYVKEGVVLSLERVELYSSTAIPR